jgi:hypothetical protein
MNRLTLFTMFIVVSMAATLLIASPTARSAVAGLAPSSARNDGFSPPMGTYLNVDAGFGSAEITFLADGHYTYDDDGSVSTEGTYKVTGNQIVFIEYGPADAACLHLPGKYTWAFAGKVLTLKEMEDRCLTRQYDWASGEWFKPR